MEFQFHVPFGLGKNYKSPKDKDLFYYRGSLIRAISRVLLLSIVFGYCILLIPTNCYSLNFKETFQGFKDKLPDFTIKQGEFYCKAKMPMIIANGKELLVIDTTGKLNSSYLKNADQGIFIGKTYMVRKYGNVFEPIYEFSLMKNLIINKSIFVRMISTGGYINLIICVLGILGFFIFNLFMALILSVVGVVFNNLRMIRVSFKNLYKLSLRSILVPICIYTVLFFIEVRTPWLETIYFMVASIYLWKAMSTIKEYVKEVLL